MAVKNSVATLSAVGAVVIVALFAVGCGSSASTASPARPCSPTPTNPECVDPPNLLTVTIRNSGVSPNPVMVRVRHTVNSVDSETFAPTPHDHGVFDTGTIYPTSAPSANGDGVTFNTVGTYNYHCALHANETARIIVTQ